MPYVPDDCRHAQADNDVHLVRLPVPTRVPGAGGPGPADVQGEGQAITNTGRAALRGRGRTAPDQLLGHRAGPGGRFITNIVKSALPETGTRCPMRSLPATRIWPSRSS